MNKTVDFKEARGLNTLLCTAKEAECWSYGLTRYGREDLLIASKMTATFKEIKELEGLELHYRW